MARLKSGNVYLPILECVNTTQECWQQDSDDNEWYDYPSSLEGYVTTPSGLRIKDLPPRAGMTRMLETAPLPSIDDGTNNLQIFYAGYVVDGADANAIADFYSRSPNNTKSKYFDLRNQDPRMFQLNSITVGLGASKLIPGLEEGLSLMRIGSRRSLIIPAALGYGDNPPSSANFLRPIPRNATLLINIEIDKVLR